MFDGNETHGSPSQSDNVNENAVKRYLNLAEEAVSQGDAVLGMHLYLAAFEQATKGSFEPDEAALEGLRRAWELACRTKERSLAEYIFEKLEPLMDPNELAVCAGQLQSMALEKLEEFGLSREELQEMTDMISQDFLGLGGPARLMKVEHLTLPSASAAKRPAKPAASSIEPKPDADAASTPEAASDAAPVHDDAPAASAEASSDAAEESVESASASEPPADPAEADGSAALVTLDAQPDDAAGKMAAEADESAVISSLENITYKDLAGFDRTIKTMRDFGIGMQDDPEFQGLVTLLNYRHGLERMPAADSFLFRSPAREDAHRFMTATLGEIGLPAIRMHMEENLQGAPVLCVMAQADNHPRLNSARNAFEGPGVLMLEDLDLWEAPVVDADDDLGGFVYATLSRGAREAINLIRSAVENPDVFVIASASDGRAIDGFFYDLLEPLTVVDIDYPDEDERRAIWLDILHDHPSMRGINLDDLVEFSAGMPRYDLYMAAREAIEDAYKTSLMHRNYVPVTTDNLFEKLAAYQPLDSKEYHALENAVVREFSRGLDGSIDDLLKG